MKKILFVLPIAVLLAAGCNSSQQASNQNPAPTPITQNAIPTASPTPTQTPSSEQTTAHKTYTNTALNFQIDIPDYATVNTQHSSATGIAFTWPDYQGPTVPPYSIEVIPTNQTLAQIEAILTNTSDPGNGVLSNFQNVTIAGQPAFTFDNGEEGAGSSAIMIYKGQEYAFRDFAATPEYYSTFKFLK